MDSNHQAQMNAAIIQNQVASQSDNNKTINYFNFFSFLRPFFSLLQQTVC